MIRAENRIDLSREILMALILAALGYFGNWLNLPVAFSVNFIFGSIFAIVAVAIMGLRWGVGVSLIASSCTYQLWNHPYAMIIFTIEILWIGWAFRRGKKNILLIDGLYWLILGIPLVIAFYFGRMQLDVQSVALIVLKQALNGVFNALVASIILTHTPLRQWLLKEKSTELPAYSTLIFHLISLSLMIPSLSLLFYMNQRDAANQQNRTVENLQSDAFEARAHIQAWVSSHVNAARAIADLGEKYPLRPSPRLQEELVSIHRLFPDFYNVFLGDGSATTIAFDPAINERGESTIGISFADRAWFKQLESTLKPVVSDVFMGRGGIFQPIFSISVPVVRDGKLVRFGLGAVNLDKLSKYLAEFSQGDTLTYSIVDRNGKLIVSSDKTRKPLTPIAGAEKGTVVSVSPNVGLWVPGAVKNVSMMKVWKDAYYFTKLPIGNTNWTLLTENSLAPTQKHLHSITLWSLGGVAAFYVVSLFLAHILSRRLSRSSEVLARISKDIPTKINNQEEIIWPHTGTAEMDQLTNNFRDTEVTLRNYVQEARQANVVLEQKVQERTSALATESLRLQTLLETASDAIHILDEEGNVVQFSQSFLNMLGYDKDEATALKVEDWEANIPRDQLADTIQTLIKHPATFETKHRRKDGSVIDVEINAKGIELDGKSYLYASARDITERKQADEALKEERRRLQQALDEIKTLRGIVPICSYCKQIRDDKGYWSQVEKYVSDHTEAQFSHGICPACFEREMKGIKGET